MLAKIGTFILDYIRKKLQSWLAAFLRQEVKESKQEKSAEKSADDFQKVVTDPTKTREERKSAETDFLNS